MKKKIPTISTLSGRIKKALQKNDSYDESFDTIIETTAGNLYAYLLAIRDLESLDSSFIKETTREDNTKLVPHPVIKIVRDQSEMIRKQLKELELTLASIGGATEDDAYDNLTNKVESIEDED